VPSSNLCPFTSQYMGNTMGKLREYQTTTIRKSRSPPTVENLLLSITYQLSSSGLLCLMNQHISERQKEEK
jgi:hypothetical protein